MLIRQRAVYDILLKKRKTSSPTSSCEYIFGGREISCVSLKRALLIRHRVDHKMLCMICYWKTKKKLFDELT